LNADGIPSDQRCGAARSAGPQACWTRIDHLVDFQEDRIRGIQREPSDQIVGDHQQGKPISKVLSTYAMRRGMITRSACR
jgi:hypothetical protein